MTRRRGFSLLEITIASMILSLVLGAAMLSFFGVRRSQGVAVTSNVLKVSGQRAMHAMYMELSQCRKLLASTNLEPPIKDLAREYFTIFQRPAVPRAIPALNMVFPRIDANGGFGLPGPNSGELEQTTVGNTLVFVTMAKQIQLKTIGQSVAYGTPLKIKLLSAQPYLLTAYKFVAYYLAESDLPAGAAPVKLSSTSSMNHTMQLIRWESQPYIELGEFKTLSKVLVGAPLTSLEVWQDLRDNHGVAGLWNLSAASATGSIYGLDSAGLPVPSDPQSIQHGNTKWISQAALQGFALDMVAFNTVGQTDYQFKDFTVPAYAPTDSVHANFPYGFEVAIVGPSGARSVLIRLALAARVHASKKVYGQAQQEVVKVFDM